MKYPYIIPQPNVYKPLIPIALSLEKTHKVTSKVFALVDSGADVCFCSEDIAFWLGSNDQKSKEHQDFTTANGSKFDSYKEDFTILACGKTYKCPFFISKELPKSTPIILGQRGFFDHFEITFNLPKKEIVFK